jgi:hypothetical protein
MKSSSAVAVIFLALVFSCAAQAPNNPTADEAAAKIKALGDQQLVDCLKKKATTFNPRAAFNQNTEHECLLAESDRDAAIIEDELVDRKHPDLLIAAYKKTDDDDLRLNLVKALYRIDDPKVVAFMGFVAFGYRPLAEDLAGDSLALRYLAQRCHKSALERLSGSLPLGPRAAMQCTEWRPIVEDFGRCDYRAAAPRLVRALLAPCSDLNDAAEETLQKFFPGACKQAHSLDQEQICYQHLVDIDFLSPPANAAGRPGSQ